jgi:hypothetical protein
MKRFIAVVVLALVAACGMLPMSPEQQIRDGSNAVTVGATVTGSLLTVDKITKPQAVSYRDILNAAGRHFNVAFKDLEACRIKTGSTPKTTPDPCKPAVQADINLGVSIAADVKKVLDAKK